MTNRTNPPKIHYIANDRVIVNGGNTACGMAVREVTATNIVSKVNCLRCRTKLGKPIFAYLHMEGGELVFHWDGKTMFHHAVSRVLTDVQEWECTEQEMWDVLTMARDNGDVYATMDELAETWNLEI